MPWLHAAGRIASNAACVGREFRELTAARDQRVGREHAGPAGVRDDGQSWPARARLLAEHLGHVEELVDAFTRSTPTRRNAASSTSSSR